MEPCVLHGVEKVLGQVLSHPFDVICTLLDHYFLAPVVGNLHRKNSLLTKWLVKFLFAVMMRKTILTMTFAVDGRFAAGSFDSLAAVELSNAISEALNTRLPGTLIYDYPAVEPMVSHIASLFGSGVPPRLPPAAFPAGLTSSARSPSFQVRSFDAFVIVDPCLVSVFLT
jgi:Phosphopantetheine attachment site